MRFVQNGKEGMQLDVPIFFVKQRSEATFVNFQQTFLIYVPPPSVLKTFIYDPLVEWSKPSRGRSNALSESGEINNEKVSEQSICLSKKN